MPITTNKSPDSGQVNIKISGQFNFNDHKDFRVAYHDSDGKSTMYVIDMADAEYLDSAALGMLLLLREHAGGDSSRIKITNCRDTVNQILKNAHFDKFFDIN